MLKPEFVKTIGHEKQKEFFLRALEKERLSHAYALGGPEHIGKTAFAREFAEIAGSDSVLDMFISDEEQGPGITEVRNLQSMLSLTKKGKVKAAILGNADRMTVQASNALLKILEDPPPHSLILIVTNNFYKLLPTIISRVQKVSFTKSGESEMAHALERFSLPDEKQNAVKKFADGRVGLGIRLAGDEELFARFSMYEDLFNATREAGTSERLKAAENLGKLTGVEIKSFIKFAMGRWVNHPKPRNFGKALYQAFLDLDANVNKKLVVDNIYL